jgi:hypothetical protein
MTSGCSAFFAILGHERAESREYKDNEIVDRRTLATERSAGRIQLSSVGPEGISIAVEERAICPASGLFIDSYVAPCVKNGQAVATDACDLGWDSLLVGGLLDSGLGALTGAGIGGAVEAEGTGQSERINRWAWGGTAFFLAGTVASWAYQRGSGTAEKPRTEYVSTWCGDWQPALSSDWDVIAVADTSKPEENTACDVGGIGVELGDMVALAHRGREYSGIEIKSVVPGSPAEKAGIGPGYRIVYPYSEKRDRIVEQLGGPAGTKINIRVQPPVIADGDDFYTEKTLKRVCLNQLQFEVSEDELLLSSSPTDAQLAVRWRQLPVTFQEGLANREGLDLEAAKAPLTDGFGQAKASGALSLVYDAQNWRLPDATLARLGWDELMTQVETAASPVTEQAKDNVGREDVRFRLFSQHKHVAASSGRGMVRVSGSDISKFATSWACLAAGSAESVKRLAEHSESSALLAVEALVSACPEKAEALKVATCERLDQLVRTGTNVSKYLLFQTPDSGPAARSFPFGVASKAASVCGLTEWGPAAWHVYDLLVSSGQQGLRRPDGLGMTQFRDAERLLIEYKDVLRNVKPTTEAEIAVVAGLKAAQMRQINELLVRLRRDSASSGQGESDREAQQDDLADGLRKLDKLLTEFTEQCDKCLQKNDIPERMQWASQHRAQGSALAMGVVRVLARSGKFDKAGERATELRTLVGPSDGLRATWWQAARELINREEAAKVAREAAEQAAEERRRRAKTQQCYSSCMSSVVKCSSNPGFCGSSCGWHSRCPCCRPAQSDCEMFCGR